MADLRTPTAAAAAADLQTLTRLVYELMDAHEDSAQLAQELRADVRWRVHLDYLRDLQRTGRELLAQIHAGSDR